MTTNWSGILGKGWTKGRVGLEHINQIYIHAFKWLLIGTAIAIGFGIVLNNIGWKEGNFFLALIFLIASTFCFFYPGFLIWIFGIGSVDGLPKDWSLNKLLKEQTLPDLQVSNLVNQGVDAIKKTVRWAAHITLFTQMFFVVLGTWELENSRVVIPILVVLAGIGLCTYLFSSTAKWYKRAAWGIMLTSLSVFVYNGYVYMHPQDTVLKEVSSVLQKNEDHKKQIELSRLLEKVSDGVSLTPEEESFLKQMREEANNRSVTGITEDFFYSKTFDVEITHLKGTQLCGILPGNRIFHFVEDSPQYVLIGGNNYEITNPVRVNKSHKGESFLVEEDGCVNISFDGLNEYGKAQSIQPQVIQIVFE